MIVHKEAGRLRVVTQNDHAHLSAELLSLWLELAHHPRREAILFAAREHDNGWRELDAAPLVEPSSGRPCDFRHLPTTERQEVWHRGVRRHADRHPYPAALIAQHALTLHVDRRDDPHWAPFLESCRGLRDELREAATIERSQLESDYRWVELSDLLSLTACAGHVEPFRSGAVKGRLAGDTLVVDPFPLAGATTFRVLCRWIPGRRYTDSSDLAIALAEARWEELTVRLAPPVG